jgi:hypothetical protein
MPAKILRIESADLVGPHVLALRFNDGTRKRVDLLPVLTGRVFLRLRDASYFARVALDPVAGTVVWPNGADFAPEFLHELPPSRPLQRSERAASAVNRATKRSMSKR